MKISYETCPISSLKAVMALGEKKVTLSAVTLASGMETRPTKRFIKSFEKWSKLQSRVFKYFTPEEVFERITRENHSSTVRCAIEHGEKENKLLSIVNPERPYLEFNNLMGILQKYGCEKADYADGVIRSRHIPSITQTVEIAGDLHENRFVVDTPIDGFGKPFVYLSLLRQVCSNGAVGYAPAFRADLATGKKEESMEHTFIRALETYNNEEGYAAIHNRFTSAAESWASVRECMMLYRLILKQYNAKQLKGVKVLNLSGGDGDEAGPAVLSRFMKLCTGLNGIYGTTNLDSFSEKKQRVCPANCKVYELLNFASELGTHHMQATGNRSMQAFIGTLISGEYDLQGSFAEYGDWKDLYMETPEAMEASRDAHALAV